MSKRLEHALIILCGIAFIAVMVFISIRPAKADSLCPQGTVLVAPLSAEQKEAVSRLARHNADLAIAHAKKPPKQDESPALPAAINRLLRYKADMALVCGVKP